MVRAQQVMSHSNSGLLLLKSLLWETNFMFRDGLENYNLERARKCIGLVPNFSG